MRKRLALIAALFLASSQVNCGLGIGVRSWYDKAGWKAEDYFGNPQVIALCRAIEADDLAEIDRLARAGADVRARGKGNMTPLLWAFPEHKVERFKKLLELGADPNVVVTSDFNTHMSVILPGDSVTQMSCTTRFPEYFDLVFSHGGDPNLREPRHHKTPLLLVLSGPAENKEAKIRRLIALGADVNANIDDEFTGGDTPTLSAINRGHFDLALIFLEAGADYQYYEANSNERLVHSVALGARRRMSIQQRKNYEKLVAWMDNHGESVEAARAEIEHWRSLVGPGESWTAMMDKEVAERKAKEKQAKGAIQPQAK